MSNAASVAASSKARPRAALLPESGSSRATIGRCCGPDGTGGAACDSTVPGVGVSGVAGAVAAGGSCCGAWVAGRLADGEPKM